MSSSYVSKANPSAAIAQISHCSGVSRTLAVSELIDVIGQLPTPDFQTPNHSQPPRSNSQQLSTSNLGIGSWEWLQVGSWALGVGTVTSVGRSPLYFEAYAGS